MQNSNVTNSLTNTNANIKITTSCGNSIKSVEIAVDKQSVTVYPQTGYPVVLAFTENGRLRPELKRD